MAGGEGLADGDVEGRAVKASEARAIVDEHLPWLRWALCLQDWRIEVDYGLVDKESPAGVRFCAVTRCDNAYRKAYVTINEEMVDDEDDLLETLRHELLHVVHADFELYRATMIQQARDREQAEGLDLELFTHACERLVGNIERILDHGLGLGVKSMMELSRKHQDGKQP